MADIRFKYAQIGGGKSMHSVIEMCNELEKTERYVVTNVSILVDDCPSGYWTFREYCQKFIEKPVDVSKRVAVLTKEQSVEFFRYLPAGGLTPEQITEFGLEIVENKFSWGTFRVARLPLRDDAVSGKLTNFAARNAQTGCFKVGCHYFIDEVHKLFSARAYHKVSPMVEDYQSELRKLDDDLTLITQNPEKVDKNFRRNATEWMMVQNMSKTVLFMGVTLNNRFRYHWFNQSEMPTRLDKPTVSGWYSFERKRRYHQLYLTMEGVGISGGLVKESSRVKGRSPLVWAGAVVGIVLIAYFLPRIVQGAITGVVGGTVKAATKGIQDGLGNVVPTNSPTGPRSGSVLPSPSLPPREPLRSREYRSPAPVEVPSLPVPGVYVRHWARVPGGVGKEDDFWVYLSDGKIAKASRGEVQGWGESNVRVFGKVYPVQ